jgi:hypothetical protein
VGVRREGRACGRACVLALLFRASLRNESMRGAKCETADGCDSRIILCYGGLLMLQPAPLLSAIACQPACTGSLPELCIQTQRVSDLMLQHPRMHIHNVYVVFAAGLVRYCARCNTTVQK